ncbi:MAG: hypothetical protein AAF439_01040 [Pseudomonadota bacterium]
MSKTKDLTPRQRRNHWLIVGAVVLAAGIVWLCYDRVPDGWGPAIVGGLAGGGMVSVSALFWHRRLSESQDDPRDIWRASTLKSWFWLGAMVLCVITAMMPDIRLSMRWTAVGGVFLTGFLGNLHGYPATLMARGAGHRAFRDELWVANSHRAGYWTCIALGGLALILALLIAFDLVSLSGLTVALALTLTAPVFFSLSLVWLEWRSGD